jgi:hypothetical protein
MNIKKHIIVSKFAGSLALRPKTLEFLSFTPTINSFSRHIHQFLHSSTIMIYHDVFLNFASKA